MSCANATCSYVETADFTAATEGLPTTLDIDCFWLIINGEIVFMMQIGFMLLEVGTVRAQHAKAICVKNAVDFLITTVTWLTFGYALAFGARGDLGDFAGTDNFFGMDIETGTGDDPGEWSMWFFQWTFTSATCTIVSGAGAERCCFTGYLTSTVLLSFLIYPMVVHWTWSSDAWLANGSQSDIAFSDFAGSGVVHLTGGICAFMMAVIVGAREGRFDKDGQVQPLQPHNLVLASTGTLLLVVGWFGFNGGSVLAASGGGAALAARVCVVTAVGAACGGISSFACVWYFSRFIKLEALCNGILGGLVSVTAGAGCLTPECAAISGFVGGILYQCSSWGLLYFQIDDPLDASPIHGVCGIWGLIAVGLFGNPDYDGPIGMFYDASSKQLGYQLVGALIIMVWGGGICAITFIAMKSIRPTSLRVPLSIELTGDLVLYGGSAYPQFEEDRTPADGEMCCVCTEVEGMAALQEWDAETTNAAMNIFTQITNDTITRCNGFKISQEDNDKLIIIFNSTMDGTNFAVTVQAELMQAEWPKALDDHPLAKKEEHHNGLRVKMAINLGTGEKFLDRAHGNALCYKGLVVDKTHELLSCMECGGVNLMSTTTLQNLQANYSHRLHEMGDIIIYDAGKFQFPNVLDPIALIEVRPKSVAGRGNATMIQAATLLARPYFMAPGAVAGSKVTLMFCALTPQLSKSATGPEKDEAAMVGGNLLNARTTAHGGYVTKTSNGVSLLSFPSEQDGFNFIKDLANEVAGAEHGSFTFNAGLHCGIPISVAPNKASGRADYLGPVVNATARLMALSMDKKELFKNGNSAAAISVDSWEFLDATCKNTQCKYAGKFELKGLSEGMNTYAFLPPDQVSAVGSSEEVRPASQVPAGMVQGPTATLQDFNNTSSAAVDSAS